MNNEVQDGNNITLNAPYTVKGGDGVQVGSIFGVASSDAAITEPVVLQVTKVYDLKKKAGDTFTAGLDIYWDDAAKETTVTPAANLKIGQAILDAAGGDATVRVRLNS
ncbi:MAG: DUF2190 family protein [Gammaproteobacteria bacterium]|nr:DUF2190 family protein [Gammaproteobacteria bacterium]